MTVARFIFVAGGEHRGFRTLLKRKARPVAPVKRVEMSSDRFVRMVSQLAQEKRRVPPMWSKKMRPIVGSLGSSGQRLKQDRKKIVNRRQTETLRL